jgi:uncharacterized membrane protein
VAVFTVALVDRSVVPPDTSALDVVAVDVVVVVVLVVVVVAVDAVVVAVVDAVVALLALMYTGIRPSTTASVTTTKMHTIMPTRLDASGLNPLRCFCCSPA